MPIRPSRPSPPRQPRSVHGPRSAPVRRTPPSTCAKGKAEPAYPRLVVVRAESSAVLNRIAAVAPIWFELEAIGPDTTTGAATPDAALAMAGLREQLTRRQFDVAMGVLAGLTNKAIARRLDLSHFTVRNHLSRIMLVLGLQKRRDLQDWLAARSAGLA